MYIYDISNLRVKGLTKPPIQRVKIEDNQIKFTNYALQHKREIKIPLPLIQATTFTIPSSSFPFFKFILRLPEGRAGEAWEPSHKLIIFRPVPANIKLSLPCSSRSSTIPLYLSLFNIYSVY